MNPASKQIARFQALTAWKNRPTMYKGILKEEDKTKTKITTEQLIPMVEILSCIAKGNWGTVYKAMDQQYQFRALKRIQRVNESPSPPDIDYRKVPDTEVEYLSRLNQEGVAWVPKLYAVWNVKDNINGSVYQSQLMELFDIDLFAYAKKWIALDSQTFDKPFQLAIELGFRGILHGDLKWNQFLLTLDSNQAVRRIVLSDFGFASDVLDRTKSWFLEGFTKGLWRLGFFHYIEDVNDTLKRKLFAVYINIQQIIADLLYCGLNAFTYRNDNGNGTGTGKGNDNKTILCIVRSFSFGRYQIVFDSLIAESQRKSIDTFYNTQLPNAIEALKIRYANHSNVAIAYVDYNFEKWFANDVKSFLEAQRTLIITERALNQLVLC